MTDHPMNGICEICKEQRTKPFTTRELVNELIKRTEDVSVIENPIHCRATIQKGNGKYSEVSFGSATILVVHQKQV